MWSDQEYAEIRQRNVKQEIAYLTGLSDDHPHGESGKGMIITDREDNRMSFMDCEGLYGYEDATHREVHTHDTYYHYDKRDDDLEMVSKKLLRDLIRKAYP